MQLNVFTTRLHDLYGDVTIISPSSGHILVFNGTTWVNQLPVTAGGGADTAVIFQAPNVDTVTLAAGMPVATPSDGSGVIRADASDPNRAAVGIILSATAPGVLATVQVDGSLDLGDWTAATGTSALAARGTYFLAPTPGMLTTTPPTAVGQILQVIGHAVSPVILRINPEEPVLL